MQESIIKCPNCEKEIGTIKKQIMDENGIKTEYEFFNRGNYDRIFKDEEEIESLKRNKDKRDKIYKINFWKRFENIIQEKIEKSVEKINKLKK